LVTVPPTICVYILSELAAAVKAGDKRKPLAKLDEAVTEG